MPPNKNGKLFPRSYWQSLGYQTELVVESELPHLRIFASAFWVSGERPKQTLTCMTHRPSCLLRGWCSVFHLVPKNEKSWRVAGPGSLIFPGRWLQILTRMLQWIGTRVYYRVGKPFILLQRKWCGFGQLSLHSCVSQSALLFSHSCSS